MARLNDPPIAPPVESIDALKRRFIRQNREIARVNSTQSQRIRNLEAEISRLLAENIGIREQAINIAQESEKWKAAYKATSEITNLKNRLEAKLLEVNDIVTELGRIPGKSRKKKSEPRKSVSVQNNQRSPAEKEWRNQQTLGGVLNAERAEQEGRLPAIHEEQVYPRTSLGTADLQTRIDHLSKSLESPELGPPPVAHFEVPEIEEQDTDPEKSPQTQELPPPDVPVSVNLENRKKRRTSALLQDIPTDDNPPIDLPEPLQLSVVKAGAKRKLDASVLERKKNVVVEDPDDFVFKKPERDIDPQGTRFTRPTRKLPQVTAISASPAREFPAVRKILAPKSTNSPSKVRIRNTDKPGLERGTSENELKIPKRPNRVDPIDTNQGWRPEELDAALQGQTQPKTPFAGDVLSPASTEPSARMPEMAITNSVEDVLNGSIGRGSRRARAAVSYAEPSLRDKMRRPGKELVGAVEGIDKRVREGSLGLERSTSEGPTPLPALQAKHDRPELPTEWTKLPPAKEEAPSPLRDKQSSRSPDDAKELPPAKHQPTKRRVSGKATLGISADYTADFTITDEAELENAVRRLSIFDPPSSPPAAASTSESSSSSAAGRLSGAGGPYPDTIDIEPLKRAKSTTSTSSASDRSKARRHSVATNPGAALSHSRSVSDISSGRPSSRQSAASSRPSSAAGQARPSSAASVRATSNAEGKHELVRKNSTSRFPGGVGGGEPRFGLQEAKGVKVAGASAEVSTRASRRRSMMV